MKLFSVNDKNYYIEITIFGKTIKHIKCKKLIQDFEKQQELLNKINFCFTNGINKGKISYEIEKFIKEENSPKNPLGNPKIIVSLTSFPDRIYEVHYAVYSILKQNLKPDMVLLYLADDEFPNKEQDLPKSLIDLTNKGLTIKWCKNLKSYKKLIPAFKEYSDDIIVTADDDIYYPENWLSGLYNSYLKNPEYIHCHRAHKITFKNNDIIPYNNWQKCIDDNSASFLNFSTSGGGVLFPPNSLYSDILKEDLFLNLAPNADDIWFYAMAVLNNRRIKIIENPSNNLKFLTPQREMGMFNETMLCTNNGQGGNDIQFKNVLEHYPEIKEKIFKERDFNSALFWETRYLNNGNSGSGSYGRLAEFKAETINAFIHNYNIESIIEFGCGDGNQLELFKFKNYLGFDVSNTILNKCSKKFRDKQNYSFKNTVDYKNENADLTMSLDVIYHLVEDNVFEKYMENLFNSSNKYVIIYSSNKNKKHCTHVRHRKFTDWIKKNKKDWILKEKIKNKYKYSKNNENETSFADFYIYEKICMV